MRILPVIDLMDGQVVRGVAGQRHRYAPMVSRLTASTQPVDVAQAFRAHFGFDELYLADLDAIAGKPVATATYTELLRQGFRLWVDAGTAWPTLAEVGVQNIIAGLESLQNIDQLRELLDRYSSGRVVFSLDLHDGQPIRAGSVSDGPVRTGSVSDGPVRTGSVSDGLAGPVAYASGSDGGDIARQAVEMGVQRILVLDLAAVGMDQGTPTEDLCARLRAAYPSLEITTGGGVRGPHDLHRLQHVGVDYVLIASALHDGRLAETLPGRYII